MRTVDTTGFCQRWLFHSGDTPWWQPTGEKFDAQLSRWHEVNLPHTFNAEDTFTPARGIYLGPCWYRKTFDLSEEATTRKVFIEFGAAFSVADVWVNECHVGQFMGGYTGFSIDATSLIHPGENLLAVKVTNAHDPDVLPGIEGKDMDYVLYGGLYREASLVIKDSVYINQHGITVRTPSVSVEQATIEADVAIANNSAESRTCACTGVLRDASGAAVAELSGETVVPAGAAGVVKLAAATVANPALWSTDTPNLYTLDVTLSANGQPTDTDSTTVGFRWFEFTAEKGFFLNGQHVKLYGINRHQDYPGLGNAMPTRLQVRDAQILREMGVNYVRLSHYPQHPVFLDACDRLGIVVYEEIASWQYIGGEMFTRNAEYMMREMIARDKNHPSVMLWGLLNEGRSKVLFERLHRVAKECDPTRLTVYADNHPIEGKEIGSVFVPDVLGINYKLPHLDEIRAELPDTKFISTETTNFEHRRRGDYDLDYAQVTKIKTDTDIIEERDYMAGMALWSMHDFGTEYELSWPIQPSGVVDCYRLPKAAYWFLRARWSPEPLVRILGHWNWTGREGDTVNVLVCANGQSVELFLNDMSLGVKQDPYLTEWEVPYKPGTLRAVAQCGNETIEHTLATAGEPAALRIETPDALLTADASDAAEITLTILDEEGNPALAEDGFAAFRVEGPGVIRGIGGIPCTPILAGTGRIVVQSTAKPGTIIVRAAYRGLPETSVEIRAE